jgi:hypothetical protein
MADEGVPAPDEPRSDMRQLPHLRMVLGDALVIWIAIRDLYGPEVAGDVAESVAIAVLMAGYKRETQ